MLMIVKSISKLFPTKQMASTAWPLVEAREREAGESGGPNRQVGHPELARAAVGKSPGGAEPIETSNAGRGSEGARGHGKAWLLLTEGPRPTRELAASKRAPQGRNTQAEDSAPASVGRESWGSEPPTPRLAEAPATSLDLVRDKAFMAHTSGAACRRPRNLSVNERCSMRG